MWIKHIRKVLVKFVLPISHSNPVQAPHGSTFAFKCSSPVCNSNSMHASRPICLICFGIFEIHSIRPSFLVFSHLGWSKVLSFPAAPLFLFVSLSLSNTCSEPLPKSLHILTHLLTRASRPQIQASHCSHGYHFIHVSTSELCLKGGDFSPSSFTHSHPSTPPLLFFSLTLEDRKRNPILHSQEAGLFLPPFLS